VVNAEARAQTRRDAGRGMIMAPGQVRLEAPSLPARPISGLGERLGAVRFSTSDRVRLVQTCGGVWTDAGLTQTEADGPFTFETVYRSLCVMDLSLGLARAFKPSAVALGGPLFALLPGEPYSGACRHPATNLSVFIMPSFIEAVLDAEYSPQIAAANLRAARSEAPLRRLMRALLEDVRAGNPSGPVLGEELLAALVHLTHPLAATRQATHDGRRPVDAPRRLRRVTEAIHEELDQPLSLVRLASLAGMSVRQLTRCFRLELGLSPHDYITRARIERARSMIATSQGSLDEIAWSVGFASRSHMALAFRKATGHPPSYFRNRAV
jgi:AraC-like DNA-binding protein